MSFWREGAGQRRGSSGPRGGRGGPWRKFHDAAPRPTNLPHLPADRELNEGLEDEEICPLSRPYVDLSDGVVVKPVNVKYIGSYNWVDEPDPTIIVPGSPPVWRDRPYPYHVGFDTGIRFVDQNGFRMGGASCLLPLLRAVDVVSEENADTTLDWSAVDFVTDRNNLRKLMRWLQNTSGEFGEGVKEFRIDLQLGGKKTVLMHRWEKRTRERAMGPRSGCGMNFETESTTPAEGCEKSTGHHRIIQYDLGGLRMVVRFEVDGYIQEETAAAPDDTEKHPGDSDPLPASTNDAGDISSLTDALSGLSVSTTSPEEQAIKVIRAGSQVPQSSILEVTTRSVNTVDNFSWEEQYPQLFLSYTPNLYLAVHERGRFERMIEHKLGTVEFKNVENNARIQRAFRQLVEILKEIQGIVKEHGQRGKLSLMCGSDGTLRVFERTTDQAILPEPELERFGV